MDIIKAIESRRSVRKFKDQAIERETIDELINLGHKAPMASNYDSKAYVAISDKDLMDELNTLTKQEIIELGKKNPRYARYKTMMEKPDFNVFYQAPLVIAIYGEDDDFWAPYDVTLAGTNIIYAAMEKSIGSCWIGFAHRVFNTDTVKEKLNVPKDYSVHCILALGYADLDSLAPPKRDEPRVSYL